MFDMFRRTLNNFLKILLSDSFLPVTYFSSFHAHWAGSNLIYGVLLSVILIISHLVGWLFNYIYIILSNARYAQTPLSLIFHHYGGVYNIIRTPFLIISWMIRGWKRIHRINSAFMIIDEKLSKFKYYNEDKNSGFNKWILLIVTPLFMVIFLTWLYLPPTKNLNLINKISMVLKLFFTLHNIGIASYVSFFFACFTSNLCDRYKVINLIIKKMSKKYNYIDYGNERELNYNQIKIIRELRAIHRKLFFMAIEISKAFGLQLLFIGLGSLISFIGGLYNAYLDNLLPCGRQLTPKFMYYIWVSYTIGPFCFMGLICSQTSYEAKHTKTLLKDYMMRVTDVNLNLEIKTFFLQVIHYELSFSVCGFFDIDLSFMKTALGTVVTYLVILIQIGVVPKTCLNLRGQKSKNFNNSSNVTETP